MGNCPIPVAEHTGHKFMREYTFLQGTMCTYCYDPRTDEGVNKNTCVFNPPEKCGESEKEGENLVDMLKNSRCECPEINPNKPYKT